MQVNSPGLLGLVHAHYFYFCNFELHESLVASKSPKCAALFLPFYLNTARAIGPNAAWRGLALFTDVSFSYVLKSS